MSDVWSDDELETLADAAYRKQEPRCPRCRARVRVDDDGYAGRATTPLYLECERCGASGEYSPDHLEAMALEWTTVQKAQIVERYWAGGGGVACPNDGSVLAIEDCRVAQPPPPELHVRCPRCGRTFFSSEVDGPAPETFAGQYSIVRKLGEGGMGAVLLVERRTSGEKFAAKRIRLDLLRADPDSVRRFRREESILRRLQHRNIVRFREAFFDETGGVIVMDYAPGGTLKDAIRGASAADKISLFTQTVEGLAYLHRKGIVHRDLKPGNILLSAATAMIADFGLARLVNRETTTLTATNAGLGTLGYMAPEQAADGARATFASDIYSLGLIAYELAVGGASPGLIDPTGLDPLLWDALKAARAVDPRDRPTDGVALCTGLEAHLTGAGFSR